MGLYNLVFGQNPTSDYLLGLLGLSKSTVGRFRDCWVTEKGNIAVYTRNGGGNRGCWNAFAGREGDECKQGCPGCTINFILPKHPLYLYDEDDDFDRTYATIYFKAPAGAEEVLKALAENRDPSKEWGAFIEKLKEA